jgi:hypothetical protein
MLPEQNRRTCAASSSPVADFRARGSVTGYSRLMKVLRRVLRFVALLVAVWLVSLVRRDRQHCAADVDRRDAKDRFPAKQTFALSGVAVGTRCTTVADFDCAGHPFVQTFRRVPRAARVETLAPPR